MSLNMRPITSRGPFQRHLEEGTRYVTGPDGKSKAQVREFEDERKVAGTVSEDGSIEVIYPEGMGQPDGAIIKLLHNNESLAQYSFTPKTLVESMQKDPTKLMKSIYRAGRNRNSEENGDRRYVLKFKVDKTDSDTEHILQFRRTADGHIHSIEIKRDFQHIADYDNIDYFLTADPQFPFTNRSRERFEATEKIEKNFFLPMIELIDSAMNE